MKKGTYRPQVHRPSTRWTTDLTPRYQRSPGPGRLPTKHRAEEADRGRNPRNVRFIPCSHGAGVTKDFLPPEKTSPCKVYDSGGKSISVANHHEILSLVVKFSDGESISVADHHNNLPPIVRPNDFLRSRQRILVRGRFLIV